MATSEHREMYLKTIYELQVEDEPAAVSQVAERLGIAYVSATEMVKRLAEEDLVVHTPYKGVVLTDEGRRRALIVVRRQRLWGRFLADHLGIPWELIYDFACRLEHATDDMVTDALAEHLGHPASCPHGNPIPNADYSLDEPDDMPLHSLNLDQTGVISRVDRPETTLCRYLKDHDLLPGTAFKLVEEAPYNGPFILQIGEQQVAVGRQIAARLFVQTSD